MAGRGRKDCPNCNTELGARCHLCDNCGYHFPTKKIRKDLLKKKNNPEGPKIYISLGKGRKKCPGCGIIVGGVTKICHKCNFDFVSAKKEKDAKIETNREKKVVKKAEEKIDPRVKELLTLPTYKAPDELSPKEHAKRILSYGVVRAKNLLSLALNHKYWGHVDWGVVEKGLVK